MADDNLLDYSVLPDVRELHPELDDDERWFAAHMLARENAFLHIFGESAPAGQLLSPDDPNLTVNWPGGGIYQYPPRPPRVGYHYVTHGLAQPCDEDDEGTLDEDGTRWSGLGIELVIATPGESGWAATILLHYVKYLLFDERASLILPWQRFPSPLQQIDPASKLTHFLAITSSIYPAELALPGGRCTMVHLVGVTEAEVEAAQRDGSDTLAAALLALGPGEVTDLSRGCITEHSDFDRVWHRLTSA